MRSDAGMFLRCFSPAYHISWRGTTKTSGCAGGFGVLVGIGCRIEKAGGHSSARLWGCVIPTRSRQACSKQACLGNLAQIICITFIIQVVQAI